MSTADDRDALTRRIEQLAAASVDEPEGEGAAVAALVGALRAEIGAVRAELGALRAETGAVRSDLDGLGGRLTGSVAASRSETGTLVRRVAELSTRLDGVGGRVDDVRNGLPSLSRELREGLEQVPLRTSNRLDELTAQLAEAVGTRVDGVAADIGRTMTAALERESRVTAGTQAAMEDIRGALESRLAVLEDTLDALSERIEALARDGAGTTTERLESLAHSVEALDRRMADEGRDSAELLVGRLRDVTETRLSELETTLFDRLSDVLRVRNDELRREVLSALETARVDAREDRQAVADLAGTVGSTLDSFGAAVSGLQADLVRRDETASGHLTGLQNSVEAKLEQVRAQVATAMTVVRSDVATEIGTLTPRVDELVVAGTAVNESLRSLRTDVVGTVEALRDRLVSASTDSTEVLRAATTETRSEIAGITRALREDLLNRIEEKYGVVADRLTELAEQITGTTAASRESTERLAVLAGLSEQTRRSLTQVATEVAAGTSSSRELTERLTELDATVEASSADLADRLGTLDGSLTRSTEATEQAALGLASVNKITMELQETVEGFRSEWPTRTFEVVQGAKAVAAGVVREIRAEVEAQLEGVREELARTADGVADARTGLDEGTDRLSGAGRALVGYLEQRDRLLEAERDRVLHDVLDTFAAGLSAKDRAGLSSRISDAVARRRDARDAERYRGAVGEPVPPVVDDLPEAVRRLTLAEQEPAATASASASPVEAAPQASAVPVKVPSVKVSPVKVRPVKAAPAKTAKATPRQATKGSAADGSAAKVAPARAAKVAPAKAAKVAPAKAAKVAPAKAAPARRGRLDAMPQVPGPDVALDAAAPPPAPAAGPSRQEPAETSWASRSATAPASPEDQDEDVSMRRLFRRRRS